MFELAAICLVITAVVSWLNARFLRAPTTIGVMIVAIALSLIIIGVDAAGLTHVLRTEEERLVRSVDFSAVVMRGVLSLLLFAGALHIDLSELRTLRWPVLLLAIVGTAVSTVVVGLGMYAVLPLVGVHLGLAWCFLFGALISPTDPIAVIGILKAAHAPKNVELVIAGESLFNDGVGVVIFSLILGVIAGAGDASVGLAVSLLAREVGGGLLLGASLGFAAYRLLKSVDEYQTEVLITLAAVMGGYSLASAMHVSGPLAMVVAGLVVGNHGRRLGMSDTTRRYVDMFWELADGILNALLFVLLGMQIITVDALPAAGVATIIVTLVARLVSVGLPTRLLATRFGLPPGSWRVFTWGGLRGGISVALVLSLAHSPERQVVLALTYAVVLFSILVQGLSVSKLIRRTFA